MMTVEDTRYISLNTQHCIKKPSSGSGLNFYEASFLSQISFDFKDVLKDDDDILYSHIDIVNAQIPVSFYLINYTTNVLAYKINNGVIQLMVLERGNYNITTLISVIKQGFLNAGYTFTITFNKVTGKLLFVSPIGTTFTILSSASGGTINEIIGFDSVSSYSSINNILNAEHPASLIGIKKLKISSSALHTSGLSSGGGGDLLGIIPVNAPSSGLILYENNSSKKGGLLRNKEISNIDITVTNEDNRFINFNNVEYSITLAITTTRILKEKINTLFRDSTQQIMDTTQPQNVEPNYGGDENDLDYFMYKHGIQI
jgi:hypothetical protein